MNDYLVTDSLSPLEMLPFLTLSRNPYNRKNERGDPAKLIPEPPSSKRICHLLELCLSLPSLPKIEINSP